EVRREQPGEPLGREMDHLEQQGLTGGEAQPLEVQRGGAGPRLERCGDGDAGGLGARRDQPRLGVEATALHLVGEAQGVADVAVQAGREREWPTALVALEPPLPRELVEGPANRDEAAPVQARQLALGWQPL